MEKLSRALTGLMLALFALALALTLALAAQEGLSRHGLIGALLAAACLTAFILRLRRKRSPELAESLGAGKAALVLSLVFLALNGVWLLCFNLLPEGDYGRFWSDAVSLSRFGRLEGDAALYDALYPHILGYASFLGLLLRLFGEQVAVAEWANLLLSLGIGLTLYGVCLRLFGLRAACAAFLLWTLCPSKTLYNALVLSEPLYTCLLLAYTLLLGFSESVDRLWAMALLGALAGLILRGVNVARPIAAVCLIALGIWILFLRGRDLKKGRDWLRWGLFLALLLAVYRPTGALWDAHVQQVTGYEPAGIPGYNFYVGFNEDTRGMYSEEDMETFGRVLNEEAGGQPKAGQQAMFALAAERIRSLSGKLPRLLLSKWKVFLADDQAAVFYYGSSIPEGLRGPGNLICNTWYYTVILLALAGAWRLWRRREQGSILTAPLFVLGLSLAQMLVEVSGRYHYSALPMLVLLAACAGGAELGSETGEG